MADKIELLLEAERRGILPADKAELLGEARRRGLVPGGDDFAARAASLSPTELFNARVKNDAFGNYLREQAKAPKPGETKEQTDTRLYGTLGYKPPGYIEGLARSYLQGSTDAGGDEAVAGAAAFLDPLRSGGGMGGTRGERYNAYLANERGRQKQFSEENPVAATAAEIAGAIPTALAFPTGAPAATLGGRVAAGGASGTLQGMIYGALDGEGEQGRARGAEQGGMVGGAFGGAVPVVGAGVRKMADWLAKNRFVRNAPTTPELRQAGDAAFAAADAIAPPTPQQGLQQFVARITPVLQQEGIDPTLHPKASRVLARFEDEAQKASGPARMDTLRRLAANVAQSSDNDEARIGKLMLREFEGFIDNTSPQYGGALSDANKAWSRYKKTQTVDDAFYKAENQASGIENGVRVHFRQILNNPDLRRGFSPDEIAAMEDVVRGTTAGNVLRRIGGLSGGSGAQRNTLTGLAGILAGGTAGSAVGGVPGAIAGSVVLPAVGYGAQRAAEASTLRAAQLARAMAATGQSAPAGNVSPEVARYLSMVLGGPGAAPYSAQLRELIYQ